MSCFHLLLMMAAADPCWIRGQSDLIAVEMVDEFMPKMPLSIILIL